MNTAVIAVNLVAVALLIVGVLIVALARDHEARKLRTAQIIIYLGGAVAVVGFILSIGLYRGWVS